MHYIHDGQMKKNSLFVNFKKTHRKVVYICSSL